MNAQVRKNCYYNVDHIEKIKTVAKLRFGNSARWSQAINYLMEKVLPEALDELDTIEAERLKTAQIALDAQRKRKTANQLGEIYKENLEELLA